jgi:hypothetical protein
VSVEGIRETRPVWTVFRIGQDEHGRDDSFVEIASFWDRAEAVAERERLNGANADVAVYYEVIEAEATVVYPADESPPWVHDPDRLRKRGYEDPQPD